MSEVLLEVKNLTVTLDGTKVLSDLNFKVDEGEFLTILGPNGSGKTVLIKAILGLLPYSGEIKWDRNHKIGYLPQGINQTSLKETPLTVKDFFSLKKVTKEKVLEHLLQVGLGSDIINKKAASLSGGEFQRMLIAWVLISNPSILVLDEPTNTIDIAGGKTINSLLKEVWQDQKLTIFNVTHDLNIVYSYSTHVLCLSSFGYRCYGVPEEILTPEVLHDIYKTDIKFHTHHKEF